MGTESTVRPIFTGNRGHVSKPSISHRMPLIISFFFAAHYRRTLLPKLPAHQKAYACCVHHCYFVTNPFVNSHWKHDCLYFWKKIEKRAYCDNSDRKNRVWKNGQMVLFFAMMFREKGISTNSRATVHSRRTLRSKLQLQRRCFQSENPLARKNRAWPTFFLSHNGFSHRTCAIS